MIDALLFSLWMTLERFGAYLWQSEFVGYVVLGSMGMFILGALIGGIERIVDSVERKLKANK